MANPGRAFNVPDDAVDPVVLGMKFIEAQIISDDQKNDNARREPQAETEDINKGISFVLKEISKGDDDVILDHASCV